MDLIDSKLEAARNFGATAGVRASDKDAVGQVRELTDGRGVDFAFVTVGVESAFEQAPSLLAPGGAVVLVGMPATGAKVPF